MEEAVRIAQADAFAMAGVEHLLFSEPELVVYARDCAPRLAWQFRLAPVQGIGGWEYGIDASSGTVAQRDSLLISSQPISKGPAANITGNRLQGEGGGTVTVSGQLEAGRYWLEHPSWKWTIYNRDPHGLYSDSPPDPATKPYQLAFRTNSNWGTSDCAEISAAFNFTKVHDYFYDVHSRNGYNNSGAIAYVNVHDPDSLDNAFWDEISREFYFGNSSYTNMTALAVLDVCAHEFTHAVTLMTGNMVYSNEPGALNESFSDIFAVCVEFHSQPDGTGAYPAHIAGHSDWLVGEDALLNLPTRCIRDLRNPSSTNAFSPCPSYYRGSFWVDWTTNSDDYGGVHINCGVQNHFFYLLTEGGVGVNDGHPYSVNGVGIEKARALAYRTLTVYCTPNTDYRAAREAWISAALDIGTSADLAAVKAAWAAVGVLPPLVHIAAADFGGGGVSDLIVYDVVTGAWYARTLTGDIPVWGMIWGGTGLLPAPGCYNGGEDKADFGVYDPMTGAWYIKTWNDKLICFGTLFGGYGLTPIPGDYDGDGTCDLAVYSTSLGQWFVMTISGNILAWTVPWGSATCLPVSGDFDGDGASDLAVYDWATGKWYIRTLYGIPLAWDVSWGGPGMTPVAGDFDGDRASDMAVYSEATGQWFIRTLAGVPLAWGVQVGGPGMTGVAGDYDGDRKFEIAAYDRATGAWYILKMDGTILSWGNISWGGPGFIPVSP